MDIHQFEDKGLAHYSYAIYSEIVKEIILIDPSRDITPYLEYANSMNATIVGVIETHPHADFISSHLELHHATGARIYCSALTGASYPHTAFDEGASLRLGNIILKALNTPGHSPDSISIVLTHGGEDRAVFTGDTLFIGDCGRPDLRENAGNITADRNTLAKQMYYSLRNKLLVLGDDVLVYPAHGAGTLCGKSLSDADSSTIAAEAVSNWSLQPSTEADFVAELLSQQPFIPKYFPYDVAINREGAPDLQPALEKVPIISGEPVPEGNVVIIDSRPAAAFKQGHLPNAINLQNGGKFETWLGSIIAPGEPYYLLAANDQELWQLIRKAAKIGYETNIKAAAVTNGGAVTMESMPLANFREHPEQYTIVDVRMASESKEEPIFENALSIPLDQLRERVTEIPTGKPVVVHCAGGYRSAAGSSIVAAALKDKVKIYDLGDAVKEFAF
ncbi:rhodanese-like domain-containing protein [Chitinophaga arvensicola]|uniref:Glyoxylase, beta-lactamase superfamily II n=1 Tax=Chitinophaga arvensicola TaxID=29529 RepID=A0A1I0S5E1_9BACT|nr:rhodanese-like domain-containing protein [Chitinophaga arvensicola]SEW49862.1 Glyoxylase, beta-lactamase superfamily II [Chitinophaga arvensicola]